MRLDIRKSFEKDISKITEKKLAAKILILIEELEQCQSLSVIQQVKKMKASDNFYRIKIGNYRIGLKLEGNTIVLLRCMDRKDIYTYFP